MNQRTLEGYAALVGDISGSRASRSRASLQTVLEGALVQTRRHIPCIRLQTTFGDEFQGLYRNLESAITATLWIRLRLKAEDADARFGLGWGDLFELRGPMAQDGPAWWAARRALDRATQESRRPLGPKGLRTWFFSFAELAEQESSMADQVRWEKQELDAEARSTIGPPGRLVAGVDALVNAYLVCRDQLVFSLRASEVESFMDFLLGKNQAEIGRAEGISQPAISRRFMRNGAYALTTAQNELKRALAP
jgi:hypothetical protein